MVELKSDNQLEHLYQQAETIAVIGAHPNPNKPAHFVPDYLQKKGYKVIPVNPKYPDKSFGAKHHALRSVRST